MMIHRACHLTGLTIMWILMTLTNPSQEAHYELSFPFYRSDHLSDEMDEQSSGNDKLTLLFFELRFLQQDHNVNGKS